MKDLRDIVSVNVKRFRKSRGLSQEEFAAKAGVSRNYLSKVENNASNLTLDYLQEIAKVLDVEAATLLVETGTVKKTEKAAKTIKAIRETIAVLEEDIERLGG